ncbi:hypothetical protein ANANG_G00001670 [Anguilla anguilla]|uniref:Uncharacterized protein n=1 Tax=Anguilla anguilla TaxID=7936 RepID=A0A9D3S5U5_ANGAN|nr:hypothetical protein ANANG_G00001670 [Anguilla anguilla]
MRSSSTKSPAPNSSSIYTSPAPNHSPISKSPGPNSSAIYKSIVPNSSPISKSPAPTPSPISKSPAPNSSPISTSPPPGSDSPTLSTKSPAPVPVPRALAAHRPALRPSSAPREKPSVRPKPSLPPPPSPPAVCRALADSSSTPSTVSVTAQVASDSAHSPVTELSSTPPSSPVPPLPPFSPAPGAVDPSSSIESEEALPLTPNTLPQANEPRSPSPPPLHEEGIPLSTPAMPSPGPPLCTPWLPVQPPPSRDLPPPPTRLRQQEIDRSERTPAEPLSVPQEVEDTQVMDGMLEIKLKPGGSKGLDPWEAVFAVLEKETLRLYQDQTAAAQGWSRWPPISRAGSVCKEVPNYRRKEHVFKLILGDGSQYLFAAPNQMLQRQGIAPFRLKEEESVTDGSETEVPHTDSARAESHLEAAGGEEGAKESKADVEPPPKPPHTYYNKHRYPAGQSDFLPQRTLPPTAPPPAPPATSLEDGAKEKSKNKSMFKKLFKM